MLSIGYYDSYGNIFSREDYTGRSHNGIRAPHEHFVKVVENVGPVTGIIYPLIDTIGVRSLDKKGKPIIKEYKFERETNWGRIDRKTGEKTATDYKPNGSESWIDKSK